MHKFKYAIIPVKYARCSNSGENESLGKREDNSDWKLGIDFEYNVRDIQKYNHFSELGFATLAKEGNISNA